MAEQQSMDDRVRAYRRAQQTAMGKTVTGAYDQTYGTDPLSRGSMTYRHFGGPEMSEKDREQLLLQYTQLASDLQQSTQRLQTRGSRASSAEAKQTDSILMKLIELQGKALTPQATLAAEKIRSAQKKAAHHRTTIDEIRASDPDYAVLEKLKTDEAVTLSKLEKLWIEAGPKGSADQLNLALRGKTPVQTAAFIELLGNRLDAGGHLTVPAGGNARDAVVSEAKSHLDPTSAGRLEKSYRLGEASLAATMDKLRPAQEALAAAEREGNNQWVSIPREFKDLTKAKLETETARERLKSGVIDKLAAGDEVDPAALQFLTQTSRTTTAGAGPTPMEVTEGDPEQPYDYMKKALDRLSINPDDRSLSGLRQEMMESTGFTQYMQDRDFQDPDFAFKEMMREYNRKRRQTVRSDRLKARQHRIQERGEGVADQMIGVDPVDDYTRREAARAADTDELGDPILKEPRGGAEVTLGGRDVADRGRPSIRERAMGRLRGRQEEAGIEPTYEGTLPGLIEEDLELADLPEGPAEVDGAALEMLDPEAELSEAEQAEIAGAPLPEAVQSEGRRGEAALEEDLLVESEFIAPADVKFDKALAARDAAERLWAVDVPADPEIPDTEFVGVEEGSEEDVYEAEQAEKRKLWGSPEEEAAPEQPPPELAPSEEEIEGIDIDAADVWDFPVKGSIEDIDVGSSSVPAMIENKKRKALWASLGGAGDDAPEVEIGEEIGEEIEEAKEEPTGALLQSPPGVSQAALEPSPTPTRKELRRARRRGLSNSESQ